MTKRYFSILAGSLLLLSAQAQTQANYLEYYVDGSSQAKNIDLATVTNLQFADGQLLLLNASGQVASLPLASLSSLRFTENNTSTTTGVNTPTRTDGDDSRWYTLQGVGIDATTSRPAGKGVYIRQGKKVIVR